VGVAWDDFGEFNCGVVVALYGGPDGLDSDGAQRFGQESPATMDGACEFGDAWGYALAAGDFDADGFSDLAVGAFWENDGGGGVHFIFGTASGLSAARNNLWTQNDGGVHDVNELADHFGSVLAAADFSGDGYADLAIGVPNEDIELEGGSAFSDAGALHVFFGSEEGIWSEGSTFFTQSIVGLGGNESDDLWSESLAAGDFDADGFADLAVGSSREGLGDRVWVGEATILTGHPGGLRSNGGRLWNQDSPGIPGANEQGDEFARALVVGDFDGTGHADLVIGAPRETAPVFGQGAVWVLYGALFADGLESGTTAAWSSVAP
jgi:hypothetical protein